MEYFPGRISLQILCKMLEDFRGRSIEPDIFGARIIFMSMFNDIDWTAKGNEEKFPILKRPNCLRKRSREYIGLFMALETKPSGMGTAIMNLKESGIPLSHRKCNDSEKQVIPFLQEPLR